MTFRSSALLITLGTFSIAALAAHQYDTSKSTTLSGSVTKVEWNNKDYVKIHMNAPGKQGKTTDWEIQTIAANTLRSDGVTSKVLKDGDQITVNGYQAANGSPHMLAQSITLANNQTVSVNAQEQPGAEPVQASANAPPSDQSLPSTATSLPLIGLIGLVSLGFGGLLAFVPRKLTRIEEASRPPSARP